MERAVGGWVMQGDDGCSEAILLRRSRHGPDPITVMSARAHSAVLLFTIPTSTIPTFTHSHREGTLNCTRAAAPATLLLRSQTNQQPYSQPPHPQPPWLLHALEARHRSCPGSCWPCTRSLCRSGSSSCRRRSWGSSSCGVSCCAASALCAVCVER
jgi:hypothetical protein